MTQTYTYNPWNTQGGRLQGMSVGTLQNLAYTYDPVGNITQIQDSVTSETQAFGYDTLDHLTSAAVTGGPAPYSESYTYDSATGNLASKAGVNYTYDTTHKHAVASLSNGNTYSYDLNGNQITRVIGADTYNLIYDAENRLIEVKKNSVTIATFAYDGDGKQVKSVVNGTTTYFAGTHYQVEGGVVTKYYFAGAQRIAFRVGGTLYYALSDHLGSTSLTTNSSGGLVSELRYSAWGETRYSNGATPTSYRYTGQREESSFGLYFFNARWVDPALGRFAQADSIIPQGQGVQARDRYAYSNNNPVRYTDPSGHCIVGLILGLFGILYSCPSPEDNPIEGFDPIGSEDILQLVLASNDDELEIESIFDDPTALEGKEPSDIDDIIQEAVENGWEIGSLTRGSQTGEGLILREYVDGKATGRLIQWHPGGGHHGSEPYWKVSSPRDGTTRIGPQFGD